MKRFLYSLGFLLVMLCSCHENVIDKTVNAPNEEGESGFKDIQIVHQIKDLPSDMRLEELKVLTLSGEYGIEMDGTVNSTTYEGSFPQIFMLTNSSDELILMSRSDFHEGDKYELSIRSTAIALVTMHPALSGVKSHVYHKLVQLVTESPAFCKLEEEIAGYVLNGQSFVDPENPNLTTALNKVFEQVVAFTDEDLSNGELPDIDLGEGITRAPELKGVTTIAGINVGPFFVTTSGAKVIIENYSLTPLYSGLVTHHGQTENFDIPSGDDRGVTYFFDNSWGRNKAEFPFVREGEYQFFFDKTTMESYFDQARHTICNVLECLGLPLDRGWIIECSDDMLKFMIARGLDIQGLIHNPNTNAWDITRTVCGGMLDYIKEGELEKMLLKIGTRQFAAQMTQTILKKIVAIYTVYQACRGAINAVMRITMRLEAPDYVRFGLYYYQGEITTATTASLVKHSGDNQNGIVGRRLNEPVCVKVTTIGSDSSEVAASNFHRVKFETDVNSGITLDEEVSTDRNGFAQTYWTLDAENTETQYLKATVIDIVTGEEISEEVVFSATPTQTANVTFTLDWSPTDSNCDIDLHIYDPDNHHIYYSDMSCACGGYLDRDDVHGPGPEHIYYAQAKPGKYHVFVHHYDSDTQGTVGFVVTTECGENRYVDRGSVPYHEYVYIGTLDLEENPVSRSHTEETSARFYYEENVPAISINLLPRKGYSNKF